MAKKIAEMKKRINEIDAELKSTGLRVLSDKNIKQTILYGENGNKAVITLATKIEVLNRDLMSQSLSKNVYNDSVTEKVLVTYGLSEPFKRFLAAIKMGTYDKNLTIKEFIDRHFSDLDMKIRDFIDKKFKGRYEQDRKWIVSKCGEGDWDAELDQITLIKNWELICSFCEGESSEDILNNLSNSVAVDETLKIEYGYPGR